MKNILKQILEQYGQKISPFLFSLLVIFITMFIYDTIKQELVKQTLKEDVVVKKQPIYKISTQKSKIYLECIYDQLECYNKNIGLEKEIVLDACKEINYCDEK